MLPRKLEREPYGASSLPIEEGEATHNDESTDGEMSDKDVQIMTDAILTSLHHIYHSTSADSDEHKVFDELIRAIVIYKDRQQEIHESKRNEIIKKIQGDKNLRDIFGVIGLAFSTWFLLNLPTNIEQPLFGIMVVAGLTMCLIMVHILGNIIQTSQHNIDKIEIHPSSLFHETKYLTRTLSILLPDWQIQTTSFDPELLVNTLICEYPFPSEMDHDYLKKEQIVQSDLQAKIEHLQEENERRQILLAVLGKEAAEKHFRE